MSLKYLLARPLSLSGLMGLCRRAIILAMTIKPLTKSRFDALSYCRRADSSAVAEETEWYTADSENVLGVVIRDKIDNDWLFLVLGRDQLHRFRGIRIEVNIHTREEATEKLIVEMREIEESGESVFPQGDEKGRRMDLFTLLEPIERLHPTFKLLMIDDGYYPAREIIREISYHFLDSDGNFVQQFQTAGFDARIWEFYLFAYLHEAEFDVDRTSPVPDFTCYKYGMKCCVEAVTANPTQEPASANVVQTRERTGGDRKQITDQVAIKLGSSLYSKLQKKYWEHKNIGGNPLIFAIQDFSERESLVRTSSILANYLYGYSYDWYHDKNGKLLIVPKQISGHRGSRKEIPSGFFLLPGTENISAVLFSNAGTIAKFNRMGYLAEFRPPKRQVRMIRKGTCYDWESESATLPAEFSYEVGNPDFPETWAQSLELFHNPRTKYPIDPRVFPTIVHHRWENDNLRTIMPSGAKFHPFSSTTLIFVSNGEHKVAS
jgi:hypothetical protein